MNIVKTDASRTRQKPILALGTTPSPQPTLRLQASASFPPAQTRQSEFKSPNDTAGIKATALLVRRIGSQKHRPTRIAIANGLP